MAELSSIKAKRGPLTPEQQAQIDKADQLFESAVLLLLDIKDTGGRRAFGVHSYRVSVVEEAWRRLSAAMERDVERANGLVIE